MPFPSTSVLDNFNRANEGPPPSANWTTGIDGSADGFSVASNQAAPQSAAFSSSYWNAATFGPDVEVYATIAAVGPFRLYLRVQQAGTSGLDGYIVLAYPPTNELYVYRVDNGSQTQLGAAFSQTIGAGDKFGASMIGNEISVYYKTSAGEWALIGTRTDSTYGSAGHLGIASFDTTGSRLDDFGGGTIVAAVINRLPPGNTLRPRFFVPGLPR